VVTPIAAGVGFAAQLTEFLLKDLNQRSARLVTYVIAKRFSVREELGLFFGSVVSIFIHWWFPWFLMFTTVEPSGSAAGKPPQNFNNSRDAALVTH
jgi:hypothetical protein